MTATNHEDDDWLYPEREVVDPQADTERPEADPGVYRADQFGGRREYYATLTEAMMLPPETPEGFIYSNVKGGGILAEAATDRSAWVATAPGRARLEREIRRVA